MAKIKDELIGKLDKLDADKDATIAAIIKHFDESKAEWNDVAEAMDDIFGFLWDNRCFNRTELHEELKGKDALWCISRALCGCHKSIVNGAIVRSPFNPNAHYFKFDANGNLISLDEKDYATYNNTYAVSKIRTYYEKLEPYLSDVSINLFQHIEAINEEYIAIQGLLLNEAKKED